MVLALVPRLRAVLPSYLLRPLRLSGYPTLPCGCRSTVTHRPSLFQLAASFCRPHTIPLPPLQLSPISSQVKISVALQSTRRSYDRSLALPFTAASAECHHSTHSNTKACLFPSPHSSQPMTQLDPPGPAAASMSTNPHPQPPRTTYPARPGTIPGSENPHPILFPYPFTVCCSKMDCCGCCAACQDGFDRCCTKCCSRDVIAAWNFVCFLCPWAALPIAGVL